MTGSTGGFNDSADRDLPFTAVHEPATLPRVQEIVIITEHSPWCTIVRNDDGVTLGDVCNQLWKEYVLFILLLLALHSVTSTLRLIYSYTEHNITEAEFTACPPRLQEMIKRANAVNGGWGAPGQFYSPAPNPGRFRRVGAYFCFVSSYYPGCLVPRPDGDDACVCTNCEPPFS